MVGIVWLIFNTNYYITTLSLSVIAIIQIISLIHYSERSTQMFIKFLNAIRYDDFSQTYNTRGLGRSFDNLNREFNKVMIKYQEIRAEKEAQYHYLRTIVQHIAIGLLVFNDEDEVELFNNSARKLLNINRLNNLNQFREEHHALLAYIRRPYNKEREVIKLQLADRFMHLAVRKTSIKLMQKDFHIISLQDIQSELEDKEMEAWQNLIRVLTHEIINSVTPIASLAATIDEDLQYYLEQALDNEMRIEGQSQLMLPFDDFKESVDDVHYAVKTIQRRSEGLIRFVRDFRSLTKVPMPNLETLELRELINSIVFLQKEEFKKNQVHFQLSIQPETLKVIADPQLLEQVLINLLKNAVQALDGEVSKEVRLKAFQLNTGKVVIQVEDNGCGISEEAMKNVFVPFFTTKKTGSGIGLSLSRQIMRLHGGSITARSQLGVGTTFTLTFP